MTVTAARPERTKKRSKYIGIVAAGEHRRVDAWVQRLHPAAEQRGSARDLLDGAGFDALGQQRRARAVRGDKVPAELAQTARERDETLEV